MNSENSGPVNPEICSSGEPSSSSDIYLMTVRVRRFMKHPTGHTVYECLVEIQPTRQVWIIFKRYRDFVALRQQLKNMLNQREPQRSPTAARGRLHPPTKRSLAARGGWGSGSPVEGGGESTVQRAGGGATGDAVDASLAKSIKTILSSQKFPNKLALAGSVALRLERRKALHAFLVELVRLRPLPVIIASFLGVLEDNRMIISNNGNYVQVAHAEKVVPMPVSPGHWKPASKKNQFARNESTFHATAGPTTTHPWSKANARSIGVYDDPGGRDATRNGDDRGDKAFSSASATTPGATVGRQSVVPLQLQKQPNVGARAWEGVPTPERWLPAGEAGQGWSDIDYPTDVESGSDSEPEFSQVDTVGVTSSAAKTGSARADPALDLAHREGGGRGVDPVPGEDLTRDWPQAVRRGVTRVDPAKDSRKTREGTASSRRVAISSSLSPSARLRGGGGGMAPDEEDETEAGPEARGSDLDPEEWTLVKGKRGEREGKQGEDHEWVEQQAKEQEIDEQQEAEMTQWEFMNGYLAEVVSKVVGRRELEYGGAEIGDSWNLDACLTLEERNIRMAELQSLGVDFGKDNLLLLLRYNDWGPEAATVLYQGLKAAGKGFLEKVIPGKTLWGMENGGNTCYIDSLLFAMFATLDAFDWLLLKPLPAKDPPEVKLLQKHLRFWVNQLRRGTIIPREHSNFIRSHLHACGWHGGPSTQEDVSELFTFLVCLLRCPALPLSEALFHGGKTDAGDSRISTERALYLALPEEKEAGRLTRMKSLPPAKEGASRAEGNLARPAPSSSSSSPVAPTSALPSSTRRRHDIGADAVGRRVDGGGGPGPGAAVGTGAGNAVTLEQILMYNFHDNRVEGLRRTVSGEKGSQQVDAWRMVSMLPFYALSGEYAGDADMSNDKHFDKIMLPMVLKRYEAEAPLPRPVTDGVAGGGGTKKSRRKVVVPHRLDCSRFMAPTGGGEGTAQRGRFVLVLKSAVCHLGGESISRGHYIAYTADRSTARDWSEEDEYPGSVPKEKQALSSADSQDSVAWLRLDDMKKGPAGKGFVERLESVHDASRLFSDHLGLHSYMLFYELVPLDLDDADKAKLKEKYALIETQGDYELALQFELMEGNLAGFGERGMAKGTSASTMCPVS